MADFRAELEARRNALQRELDALNLVLGVPSALLGGGSQTVPRKRGRPAKNASVDFPDALFGSPAPRSASGPRKRRMSAEARKRLSDSAKKRWAVAKKAGKSTL